MGRRRLTALVLVLATAIACTGGDDGSALQRDEPNAPSTTATTVPPRGGVIRVAVWEEPDPTGATITAAGLRALLQPQLFRATPAGEWEPWLVDGATVVEATDHTEVSFHLVEGADWSDGTPITGEDLARDADLDVVAEVRGSPDGTITVTFTQPLPGWRALWSGDHVVAPPADGVFGGPFVLAERDAGLKTVLAPNDAWWGDGPYVDRLELLHVPDDVTAFQLLERGEVDVVAPRAATARISELSMLDDVTVDVGAGSGWWFGAEARAGLPADQRAALLSLIDERTFVETLLDDEATVLEGFGPAPDVWADPVPGDPAALAGATMEVTFVEDDPVAGLVHRVIARGSPESARIERKAGVPEAVGVFVQNGEFDLLLDWRVDDPDLCHRCRWAALDRELAFRADAGDEAGQRALLQRLRDDALLLPLWRPTPMVAHADHVEGPAANGWARLPTWNAETWFVTGS